MKPPPPGPATNGLVTPSVLAVATAASIALPPCFSTAMPALLASRSMDATAPPVPTATGSFPVPDRARPETALATDGGARSAAASADMTETATKRRMSTSEPVDGANETALSVLLRTDQVKPGGAAGTGSVRRTSAIWRGHHIDDS